MRERGPEASSKVEIQLKRAESPTRGSRGRWGGGGAGEKGVVLPAPVDTGLSWRGCADRSAGGRSCSVMVLNSEGMKGSSRALSEELEAV